MSRIAAALWVLSFAAFVHAEPSIDWSKAQLVSMLLLDDKFVPDHLRLRHGVPYQLHMENRGKDLHEFTAPVFLTNSIVRDPSGMGNGGREVVVQPGQAVDVYLVPVKQGTFRLVCADHDWDGMVGEIVVD